MERQIRNSLEALSNLIYLAQITAPSNAKASVKILVLAEHELNTLVANLTPVLSRYTAAEEPRDS
jgi:hypothetical protein